MQRFPLLSGPLKVSGKVGFPGWNQTGHGPVCLSGLSRCEDAFQAEPPAAAQGHFESLYLNDSEVNHPALTSWCLLLPFPEAENGVIPLRQHEWTPS